MKKNIIVLYAAAVLGVSVLVGCDYSCDKKVDDSVSVKVESSLLWNTYAHQKDSDGDKLASPRVSWDKFLSDAYRVNGVENARDLEKIARNDGKLKLPRENINSDYDFPSSK